MSVDSPEMGLVQDGRKLIVGGVEVRRLFNFNTCPLCKDEGKRVILMYAKSSDTSDPCDRCGTSFRPYIVPKQEVVE